MSSLAGLSLYTACSKQTIEKQYEVLINEGKIALIADLILVALAIAVATLVLVSIQGGKLGPISGIGVMGTKAAYAILGAAGGIIVLDTALIITHLIRLNRHLRDTKPPPQPTTEHEEPPQQLEIENTQLKQRLEAQEALQTKYTSLVEMHSATNVECATQKERLQQLENENVRLKQTLEEQANAAKLQAAELEDQHTRDTQKTPNEKNEQKTQHVRAGKRFDENKIRTELLNRGVPNKEIDCIVEIVKEITSQSTIFGEPIVYNKEGMAYLRKNERIPFTLQVYQTGSVYIHLKSAAKKQKDLIAQACQKKVYRTIDEPGAVYAASVIKEENSDNRTTFETEKTAHTLFKGCRYVLHAFEASSYSQKNSVEQKYSLITEHCDGCANKEFLDQLPPKERWEFFLNILEGVQAIHDRGYCHFDLKSGNILYKKVNGRYEPRIIDFGVMHQMGKILEYGSEARGGCRPPENKLHENFPFK